MDDRYGTDVLAAGWKQRQAKQLAKKYKRTTKDLEKKSKKLKKKFS